MRVKMGRSKIVAATTKKARSQVMSHGDFIERIRKTLYYGMAFDHGNRNNSGSCDVGLEVSRPLAEYASDLFSEPHRGHSLNRLTRVAAGKSHAAPCSLIMALIYLDRLNVLDPGYVRRITPQELFVISLMISTKYYAGHDQSFYLEDWAREGCMSVEKFKTMELEFLTAIDWKIYISNEQFFEKLSNIEYILAQREGCRRGWLTYTELVQLLPSFTMIKFLTNSISVMALSYAASIMTIAGAFFLVSQIPGTLLYRKPLAANTTMTTTSITTIETDLPTTTDDLTQATPVVMLSRNKTILRNNNSIITTSSISTPPNATCNALNVEEELQKLEQQYCDEAKLINEQQLRRKRSIAEARLMLPYSTKYGTNSAQQYYTKDDNTHNWLAHKSVYSDDDDNHGKFHFGETFAYHYDDITGQPNYYLYEDCLNTQNGSIFWQLFNGVLMQTYERLPEFWFKLI